MAGGIKSPAVAQASAGGLKHFKHTAWTIENGAPVNIQAIAQSQDGYLWLGSATGAYRFDGVTFERISAQPEKVPQSESLTALLAAKSGDVWLGHFWGGISVYRNGKLHSANPAQPHGIVRRILEDRSGVIWVGTDGIRFAGLLRNDHGKWDVVDASWGLLPKSHLSDILTARDGTLWIALDGPLMILRANSRRLEMTDQVLGKNTTLAEAPDGTIWATDAYGMRPIPPLSHITIKDGGTAKGTLNGHQTPYPAGTIFDRNGGVWENRATDVAYLPDPRQALKVGGHWTGAGVELFSQRDGLSGGASLSAFEDREDNIWIGTTLGLDRFRPKNVITALKVDAKPVTNGQDAFQAISSADGKVYLGVGGSNSLIEIDRSGRQSFIQLGKAQLNQVCSDNKGTIWIGTTNQGFFHFADNRLTSMPRIPGLAAYSADNCAIDGHGTLWASIAGAGVYRYDGRTWSRFDLAPELKGIWPWPMLVDHQGRVLMYFGTRSLMRVDGDRVETLWDKKDIAIGFIHDIYRGKHAMMFGGETGLARLDGQRFTVLSSNQYPFLKLVSGISETAEGDTWLTTASGIVRIATAQLDAAFAKPGSPLNPNILDVKDGVPGVAQTAELNDIAQGADGRLWFALTDGVASVDPNNFHRNKLPPQVIIRSLTTAGRSYPAPDRLGLAKGTSDIEIDYTATSLSIPERVQFRYKLDGVDSTWIDPGTRRQAFYTNLSPGTYHFQVIAANDNGVWNKTGANIEFTIPPTFLQSWPFKALCALAVLAVLFLLYSWRLKSNANGLRKRLEERLSERERIARELHDTLLQGFQALVLRLQNVIDRIPPGQQTRQLLEEELESADAILIEGRNRVRDLRATTDDVDLCDILAATAQSVALNWETRFEIAVRGDGRDMHPVARDEISRIGSEAIINAYKHASATVIDVMLVYGQDRFILKVTDDGVGFDMGGTSPNGRHNRFGLMGMRERAGQIHSKLTIGTARGAGTNVELIVPAAIAYASTRKWGRSHPLSRTAGAIGA